MDSVDFVDDIAKEVTVDHTIDGAFEDGGDHVAAVSAVHTLKTAEVGEEARAFLAVGTAGFFVIHEGN